MMHTFQNPRFEDNGDIVACDKPLRSDRVTSVSKEMSYAFPPSPVETGGGGAEAASNSALDSFSLGDDHPASEGGKVSAVPTANHAAASTHPTKASASLPPQSTFGLNECQKDVSCIFMPL